MESKLKVAVIFGGQSSEHEVSRVSAQSVLQNIDRDKYEVVTIGITKDGRWFKYDGPVEDIGSGAWLESAGKAAYMTLKDSSGNAARGILRSIGADSEDKPVGVIFPVLHGSNGEDGTIQGLFEMAGLPYVGCGVLASALGMDKAYSKLVFAREGIPQGDYLVFLRKQIKSDLAAVIAAVEERLTYPCFVKPSNAGSSVGVSKASDREGLKKALALAALHDRRVLVEEFINGREIECAVLGNDEPLASVAGEIIPGSDFYDYEDKYKNNTSKTVIPAVLPRETSDLIRSYAVKAFKSLDCAGLSRVDFFVHKETGAVYINEINTLPGFTGISMYPKLWEATGLPYRELIGKLIDLALERFEDCRRMA